MARPTVAAPPAALAPADAPTPEAPLNAITVSDWCAPPDDCVLETVTLVSTVGAEAFQISASPNCVAARRTRVHARPAPAMVSVCPLVAAGLEQLSAEYKRECKEKLFNEPGGISISGGKMYVADTNNHRIQVVDMKTKAITTLRLQDVEPVRRESTVKKEAK